MALADPTDNVIRLADGRMIGADGKEVKPKRPMIEVPAPTKAQDMIIRANRRIADLPALPDKMNGLSAVLTYTLFGLADSEIAIALNLTIEQIQAIRQHDAYNTLFEAIHKNVTEADADVVRRTIAQHTAAAVQNIVNKQASDDDKTSLNASKDILDRAGYRPVDVVEHKHSLSGTLKIVHVDKRSTDSIPTIDITPKELINVESD